MVGKLVWLVVELLVNDDLDVVLIEMVMGMLGDGVRDVMVVFGRVSVVKLV